MRGEGGREMEMNCADENIVPFMLRGLRSCKRTYNWQGEFVVLGEDWVELREPVDNGWDLFATIVTLGTYASGMGRLLFC